MEKAFEVASAGMSKMQIDKYKNKFWFNENHQLHRSDGPAIEYTNGTKKWCINGKLHRINGPAIENANGDNFWLNNGLLHRIDGPAVEHKNGKKEYWYNNTNYLKIKNDDEWAKMIRLLVLI